MNKDEYLKRFRIRLNAFYIQVRDYDNKDLAMKQGIEAFMEAGLSLDAVTRTEFESVIADEHQKVFGMGIRERSNVAKEEAAVAGDYSYFDPPAWMR